MDVNSIKTWIEIGGMITASIVAVWKAFIFLKNDNASTTLLSYGDRQKLNALSTVALFVAFVLVAFLVGVGIHDIGLNMYHPKPISPLAKKEKSGEWVVWLLALFSLFVSVFSACRAYGKEKELPLYKKYVCFSRYLALGTLHFVFLIIAIFGGYGCFVFNDKKEFYIYNVIVAVSFSFCITTFIFILYRGLAEGVAFLKFYDNNEKKALYLFDYTNGLFTAGDNIRRAECSQLFFLDSSKVTGKTLYKAKQGDILFWPENLIEDLRPGKKDDLLDILQAVLTAGGDSLRDKNNNVTKKITIEKKEKGKVTYRLEGVEAKKEVVIDKKNNVKKFDICICQN